MDKGSTRLFDRAFGKAILGFPLFMAPFLAGWWTAYALAPGSEAAIEIGMAAGAVMGIAANLLLLKKLSAKFYSLGSWAGICLAGIYTIGIFGFFMGVPVFNPLVGVLAGVYIGRQASTLGYDAPRFSLRLRHTQVFLFLLLLMVCAASAVLALGDPYTAANLEGMFSLNFQVTVPMLAGTVLLGGALLLGLQFLMVKASAAIAYKR